MRLMMVSLVGAVLAPTLAFAQLRVPPEWAPVDDASVAHKATGQTCPRRLGAFELYELHNRSGQALCLYKVPCTTCDPTSPKASFALLPKRAAPLKEFVALTVRGATRVADPTLLGAAEAARLSMTERGMTVEATLWVLPMDSGVRVVSVMGAPEGRAAAEDFAKAALGISNQPAGKAGAR